MNPLDNNFLNHPQNRSSSNNLEEVRTEKLTSPEKEQLYKMYVDTYASIDGNYFKHDEFMAKFPEHYDVVYYQKSPHGEIVNVIFCNTRENENGVKICLICGKNVDILLSLKEGDSWSSQTKFLLYSRLPSGLPAWSYIRSTGF